MLFFQKILIGIILFFFLGCGGTSPASPKKKAVSKIENTQNSHKMEQIKIIKNPYNIKKSEQLTALTNYFLDKDLAVKKPDFPEKPQQPKLPSAKNLTKGKYEKQVTFEARVEAERQKRIKVIRTIENDYAKKVKVYNETLKQLRDDYNNKVAKKQKNIDAYTSSAVAKAYGIVYGKPYLENSLKYDAEKERFFGHIKSTKGDFDEQVAIDVPIAEAEAFENAVKALHVRVVFDYTNNALMLKKVLIQKESKSYLALLSNSNYESKNISVAINNGDLNLPATPLLSSSLHVSPSDYNIGAINYSKDPEIAALQKKKYELEHRVNEQKQSKQHKADIKRKKEAYEAQIALLEQKVGGYDDIPKLLKNAKQVKTDSTKWLFIIAIESYDFTDPVAYAANSAKRFKAVMKKRLGVEEKNIRTLINSGATSGKIRYYLQDMLAHVKSGDTIYFYYSGHGVPVASQGNAPYLLAQDMSPDYIANDPRFKLQNIYQSLSNSKASKVVAIVDSCFSGGTDNQALFKGVAASRLAPKKVKFNKGKMLVISAGSGTQYSNKYDEKSNRLFSYYVMRGLIKNNSNTQRLYDYVKSNVQEKSYEMGASYEQVPVFSGNIKLAL